MITANACIFAFDMEHRAPHLPALPDWQIVNFFILPDEYVTTYSINICIRIWGVCTVAPRRTQTLKGNEKLFELAGVRVNKSCRIYNQKNSQRIPELSSNANPLLIMDF
jgi:hypothetical protein